MTLQWNSPLTQLSNNPKRPIKSIVALVEAGFDTLESLLWLLPKSVETIPTQNQSFHKLSKGVLFRGQGTIRNLEKNYPFYGKRRKGPRLENLFVTVQDSLSPKSLNLRWFNAYPGVREKLERLEEITFLGVPSIQKNQLVIVNPQINPKNLDLTYVRLEYPQVNLLTSKQIEKVFQKIPKRLWYTPLPLEAKFTSLPFDLLTIFRQIHGFDTASKERLNFTQLKEKILYTEFFLQQFVIDQKRKEHQKKRGHSFTISLPDIQKQIDKFPFTLTQGQHQAIKDCLDDFQQPWPMKRLIQGDVGSGKTAVVQVISAVVANQTQIALLAPTETLAKQHYKSFSSYLGQEITTDLLIGQYKESQLQEKREKIRTGKTQLIIGTHSLFQEKVIYHNLGLVIIDEQHKFGVEQREKLIQKGDHPHLILLSATPIPRSLQQALMGDLNITSIKDKPPMQKVVKTKIIHQENFHHFLTFIKTRVSIGEQIYVVTPAIGLEGESSKANVIDIHKKLLSLFPEMNIEVLHGKLKGEEVEKIIDTFSKGNIDLLIATSIIEVGINIPSATTMCIWDPHHFGLSSLHQLRGRVGRGDKPGFCFLIEPKINENEIPERLKILEETTDGFIIAEKDLETRGYGDLTGKEQSGMMQMQAKNLLQYPHILEQVTQDIRNLNN